MAVILTWVQSLVQTNHSSGNSKSNLDIKTNLLNVKHFHIKIKNGIASNANLFFLVVIFSVAD